MLDVLLQDNIQFPLSNPTPKPKQGFFLLQHTLQFFIPLIQNIFLYLQLHFGYKRYSYNPQRQTCCFIVLTRLYRKLTQAQKVHADKMYTTIPLSPLEQSIRVNHVWIL